MTDPDRAIDTVMAELAQLRARVEAQETELSGLRSEQPVARRHLLRGLAGLGAAGVVGVAAAQPAAASNGDTVLLGQTNSATTTTRIDKPFDDQKHAALMIASEQTAIYATTVANPSPTPDPSRRTAVVARGESFDTAVQASTGVGHGVYAENDSPALPTVVGSNQGVGPAVGAASLGHGAQLVLFREDGATLGPPPGYAETGYIRLDAAGDIWVCTEGAVSISEGDLDGPFAWTRLLREDTAPGRTVPITPIRVLDTRTSTGRAAGGPSVPGQVHGPLNGGKFITLHLAGIGAIPDDATGVVGNLVALTPNHTGYVRVQPAGASTAAGSVNFNKGEVSAANAFTTGLRAGALSAVIGGAVTNTTHLVVDIAAYIT